MAGGVGILRIDGGIEALDRLQRALLEAAVGVHQLAGAGAKRDCLALHRRRRVTHEQRQRRIQRREDGDNCEPDDTLARGDETFGALGLGVDLVCAECVRPVRAHDRGVDLEDVTQAERSLRRVLVVTQLVDRSVSPLQCDRLPEVPRDRGGKAVADPLRSAVRPDERPVRAPHLDGDEIGLAPQLGLQLLRKMGRDV